MDPNWEARFQDKFRPLQQRHKKPRGAVGISLKFRVPGGFSPWNSQEAFDKLESILIEEPFKSAGAIVVPHETGPEILFWGLSVAKVGLIVASAALAVNFANLIINVRRKQNAQGPIEVVYRGGTKNNYREDSLVTADSRLKKLKEIEFEMKISKLMDQWFEEDKNRASSHELHKSAATNAKGPLKKPTKKSK